MPKQQQNQQQQQKQHHPFYATVVYPILSRLQVALYSRFKIQLFRLDQNFVGIHFALRAIFFLKARRPTVR